MMTLALISPLANFAGMVFGMAHQIKIVYAIRGRNLTANEVSEKLELLSVPRIMFGIFCGILSMLYGLEIHNYWMFGSSLLGVLMNLVLTSIIWIIMKDVKSR